MMLFIFISSQQGVYFLFSFIGVGAGGVVSFFLTNVMNTNESWADEGKGHWVGIGRDKGKAFLIIGCILRGFLLCCKA